MKLYEVADVNGKMFKFQINDILDMTVNPANYDADAKAYKVTTDITDFAGKLMDVSDSTSGSPIAAIDVTFEATHSGSNANHVTYQSESMQVDAASFLEPFGKPLLKNHDSYEEPLGRAVASSFKQSAIDADKDCIELTFRVTDAEAIPKFLDGRYKTISIGGNAKDVTCQLCGKQIVKDGALTKFCGHWKGEIYDGVRAKWLMTGLTYKEGSVVNMPADSLAQVVRIKTYTQDQLADAAPVTSGPEETNDSSMDDGVTKVADSENISSIIDGLDDNESSTTESADNEAGNTNDENTEGDGVTTGADGTAEEAGNAGDAELEQKLNDLNDEIVLKDARIAELEEKVATLQLDVDNLFDSNTASVRQTEMYKSQAVRLAKRIKSDIVDKIVDSMIAAGEIKDEEVIGKKEELSNKTASELEDMVTASVNEKAVTADSSPVTVTNPGLANNTETNVIDAGDGSGEDNKTKTNETSVKSNRAADFEAKLLSRFGF